jgi:hypothetical protein
MNVCEDVPGSLSAQVRHISENIFGVELTDQKTLLVRFLLTDKEVFQGWGGADDLLHLEKEDLEANGDDVRPRTCCRQ